MPYDSTLSRHPAFGKRATTARGMPLDGRPLRSLEQARADLSPSQRDALGRLGIDPAVLAHRLKPWADCPR